MSEKLAMNGGTPVRNKPLPLPYCGASVYGQEEIDAVTEVINAKSPFRYYGFNVLGKVKQFEAALCEKFHVAHALGVTSGTASIITALKAAGIQPGDKVIVPAITFIASAGAVVSAGAVPVFAECDDSFNLDPSKLEDVIDKNTKAILTVPILGNSCDMDPIMAVAKKHGLMVIEDVAQSMGSKYKGQYSGTFGDVGAFSLQMNKILTTGDGGVVVSNNPKCYERAVRFHDQGMFREREGFLNMSGEDEIFIAQNFRMSEITGAIALAQFGKLDQIISKMRKINHMIKDGIKDIDGLTFRRIVDEEGEAGNAIIAMLPTEELSIEFSKAMAAENVGVGRLYGGRAVYELPQIMNQMTVDSNHFPFNQLDEKVEYAPGMCPNAEGYCKRNLQLGITPAFTEEDAEDVIKAFHKVAKALL